ncbi:MAG: GumC family protein [Janthinobacterium lividum]
MNDTQYASYQAETSLSDVARALWRRKWIILLVTLAFVVGAYFVNKHTPKQWQAEAQLLLIQRPEGGKVGAPDAVYTAPVSTSIETQIGMLQTAEMADRTLSWLKNRELTTGQTMDIGAMDIGSLQHSLTVVNPKDSELINLAVLAPSRDQAIVFTNAVAQSFVQWKREQARKDVQATELTLAAQTRIARRKMESALQKQLAYQQGHTLVDASSQARIVIDQLQAREANIANIQQELDGQQAQANMLAAQLKATNQNIQSNGPRDDALTTSLNSQLSQLEIQRNAMAQQVTAAYPGRLPLLDAQIKDIRQRLAKAIGSTRGSNIPSLQAQGSLEQSYLQAQTQMAGIQARLTKAMALKNEAQQQMKPLVQTGSTYNQLARQAEEASAYYTGLQSALVSARLEENKINGDVQITQFAIAPESSSKPNLTQNLMLGGLLGLFISLALVLILEQTDHRLRTEDQVERLGSGPVLGALPRLSRSSLALLDRKMLPAPVAESYSLTGANLLRMLGTSLTGQGRIVMVTSAQAGEGKSLTAAELARSLARSGKRVILVDGDMRQPALNTLFDNAREEGLVEVLSGKALLDDALSVSETPNLSVLFNNASRANSADIIVSPHMTNFLQMIRNRAEIIVIDTPSCTFVDPLLLAPSVDFVLQVIDLGRANEDAVNSTTSVLSGLAPLGLFINRTSKKNAPAYEIARSFAATQARPEMTGSTQTQPFSADRTLMMFRNTSGYSSNHLNGVDDPLEDAPQGAHDLAVPLKNHEDH